MRKGVGRKALTRKGGRRQRYQITTSQGMMGSLPAAEGLALALGCAPATAERCAVQRSARPVAVPYHQHQQHSALQASLMTFASARNMPHRRPAICIAVWYLSHLSLAANPCKLH